MKYLNKSFTVPMSSKQYRDNYDSVFGLKCVKCKKKYKKLDNNKYKCKCGIFDEKDI